jgi:hypothetical protein
VGNTPEAQVTTEANGAGRFADIAITNVANTSASYQYGSEYRFSGEWLCAP